MYFLSIVLNTNLNVNEKGKALVSYEILKNFINLSLKKLPFEFNDAQNKIQFNIGIDEKYIEKYELNTAIKNRKFLYFKITESRIKDQNKSRAFFETIKNKLETPEDPTKLEEIIKNIKDIYEKRKIFCFYFNRSNYLQKFVNEVFDIELIEPIDGSLPKKIVFSFKNIDDITPRSLKVRIHQGTLLIHKDGPPKVVKHFMGKDYAIMKLFSLMDRHSNGLKDVYDILITCDERVVNQIFHGKNYDNQNVFFGKYSKEPEVVSHNFYVSKLRFAKFLKPYGRKFFKIPHKHNGDNFEIPFYEEMYDQYLVENIYTQKELDGIKEKAIKGISEYFSHYFKFLEHLKKNKSKYLYKDLTERDSYIVKSVIDSIGLNKSISVNKAYDQYLTACDKYGTEAYTKQTFKKHVKKLNEQKFISLRKKRGIDAKNIYLSQKSKDYQENLQFYDEVQPILEKLNELDFSIPIKREVFDVDVKVHFLDNMDVLITRDKDLEIDYSSNPILEGLEDNVEKGRDLFVKEYDTPLKNKELFKIDDKFYKTIFYTLKNLKYSSALDFRPEFFKDCFYYFAILKNNIDFIKSYFLIKNNLMLDTVAVVLGIQNSFRKYFPKDNTAPYFNLFFNSKFANFSEINLNTLVKIKKFCQDMIFIFEATQDLKLLQRKFKDKFRSNIEFKSVVKNIEKLVNKKFNAQKDLGEIFEVIKEGVQVKKDSAKDANEIKEILEQKLKGEFSEEQYVQSVKSIEELLKSKMKPIISYDTLLKQIDLSFKKQVTTNKQVNKIIEYIDLNVKKDFGDKEKFDSILQRIRKIYDSKFENKKKYSSILRNLEKDFKTLNTEKGVHKIQSYIEENLEDVFESSHESQNIFRQIDRNFLNKMENPKELEDIIKLSAELVKIFINDTVWHNILTASIFAGFVLALNKDKEISIASICKDLDVLPTSVSLQIKKLLANYLYNKKTTKFDTLKITDEETRKNVRLLLVKQLLESNIYMVFKTNKKTRLNRLIEGFKLRINFFTRYEQFNDSLNEVSEFLVQKYIKELIHEIKNIEKIKEREILLSDLTFRINFFKNYELFNDVLISLKEDIEGLEFLTPESKEIVLHKFNS